MGRRTMGRKLNSSLMTRKTKEKLKTSSSSMETGMKCKWTMWV